MYEGPLASFVHILDSQRIKSLQSCHALRRAVLCSIVPHIVFHSAFHSVSAFAANQSCASLQNPFVWLVCKRLFHN